MAPRTWARISLGAVAIVLGFVVLSAFVRPTPCGGLPEHYPPILAFELARAQADLDAIFGDGPSACRDAMIAAMDQTNWIDLCVFMIAYGVFLFAWFASFRAERPGPAGVGMALVVIAVVFDGLEDACLLALTPEVRAEGLAFVLLPWMTGIKWLALGAIAIPEAMLLWPGGAAWRVAAVLAQLALVVTVGAMIAPATLGPLLTLAVAAAWVPCLVSAARRARG